MGLLYLRCAWLTTNRQHKTNIIFIMAHQLKSNNNIYTPGIKLVPDRSNLFDQLQLDIKKLICLTIHNGFPFLVLRYL